MLRPLVLASALFASAAALAGASVLQQYAVKEAALRDGALEVLQNGLGHAPMSAAALLGRAPTSIPPAARAALVVAALDLVKATVNTPAVRDRLAAGDTGNAPVDPRVRFAATEQEANARLKPLMAADLKGMPPEERAMLEKMQAEASHAVRQMLEEQRAQLPEAITAYEAERARWVKTQRPGEVVLREALRKVLGQFVAGTDRMPWDVPLTLKNGRRLFSVDSLEARPTWWKACFRAGKEPTEAARTYAKAWLAELK